MDPYFKRRFELSVEQDCVLWGLRVVIPRALQDRILEDLHADHPGVCRMKSLARSYLWWPSLDKAIESVVQNCTACQLTRKQPATAPLIPWKWKSEFGNVIPLTSVVPPPVLPVPSGVTPSKSLEPTSPGPSDPGPTPLS